MHHHSSTDHSPCTFFGNIADAATDNTSFRRVYWTGQKLQLTLMCIPPEDDIGWEVHEDTDQYIRVEDGQAWLQYKPCPQGFVRETALCEGEAVFIACGTWHNIRNNSNCPLKLSSVYAPPHHPRNTLEYTK